MLTTYDEISAMLAELGPELDFAAVSMFPSFQSWVIEVDVEGDDAITVDYDEASGKLYMSSTLCPAPKEQQLHLYNFLLQFNLAWSDSGGVRMALDGTDGNVVQLSDVVLHGLDHDTLKNALAQFTATTRAMRIAVGEAAITLNDDAQLFGIQDTDDLPEGTIKV